MERKKSRFSIFTKSIRKAKEKRIAEGVEPDEGPPNDDHNNETNISESTSAADNTSLNPFEDDIQDESASDPTLSLGHMTRILSASKEVLDGQSINSPDLRRLQQQADYTTGTSDHCATPSEISETYDDVEEPYFMRTETGQLRRSTAASKNRTSIRIISNVISSNQLIACLLHIF